MSEEHATAASTAGDGYVRVRRRSQRSSRRRSRNRRRRLLARGGVVLAILGIVAVPALVIARDLVVVQRALVGADAELRDARAAFAGGDLTRASGAVRSADLLVAPLRGRVDRPVWSAAARLPLVGGPLSTTRAVVDVAAAGSALARTAVDDEVVELFRDLRPQVQGGQVELTPLVQLGERLERLDPEPLREALERLERTGWRGTDGSLASARRSLLDLGGELVTTLERTRGVVQVVPGLLGAEGPRRHLVVLQTSAELRGTGGLFGTFTLMDVDAGRVTLAPTRDASLGPAPGAGVTVPAAFATRYGHVGAARSLSNVNVDPDLATTAQVALDLFADRTGTRADSLILLDPFGLEALLVALDVTLTLPADLIAGTSAPAVLPADRFAHFSTVGVYDLFGDGREVERDALVLALGDQALAAVFDTPWDGPEVIRAVLAAARGRHLQIHSARPAERAVLRTTPVGGDLAGFLADASHDGIVVTHNNAVGGKQDVHLGHRTAVAVRLAAPSAQDLRAALRAGPTSAPDARTVELARSLRLETSIENTLTPGAFDRYIVGNCVVGEAEYGCFRGPVAVNGSWVTAWLAADERVRRVSDDEGLPPDVRGTMHAATTLDLYVEVRPTSVATVRIESDGLQRVEIGPDGMLTYRMALWRQAKGVPDTVTLEVSAPAGYRVDDAGLSGGRSGLTLAGPDAAGEPVRLRTRRSSVAVTGTVTADLVLWVRFAPTA